MKAEAKLCTHREVARMLGISTDCLRKWSGRGTFPRPHSSIEQTWFYRKSDVDHFIATGRWPEGMAWAKGAGRGRES